MFEGWDHIELHKTEKHLPVFLESEDVDSHNAKDHIILDHAMRHCVVFLRNINDCIFR